ncbi:MAG: ethanolamine utilization protein EutA [Thalassolituus oleivorans]
MNTDELPVRNIPVVQPNIDWQQAEPDVCEHIISAGKRMDLRLGEDRYAIAFDNSMPVNYKSVSHTAQQLATYFLQHGNKRDPAIVITQNDLGKVLGMELQPLIDPQQLLVIDEVRAREGDFIDIGQSFFDGDVVPLTIKSLAFPA